MTIDAFSNLAFDRASIRAFDDDGHMHVKQTPISKATVNPYNGSEIPDHEELGLDPDKVYNLLRDPKELEKAAATFNGKPLLFTHKPVTSVDHDFEGTVGAVSNATYQHPYLMADLAVHPQNAIDAIKSGEQKELSSAYRYRADMTPGEYEGTRYDGVMRDIKGNHVALVKEGRAGPDVVVGDSVNGMKDIIDMPNKTAALSRTAIAGPIAFAALCKPKLAKDAKIDWSPLFKGVNAKNFRTEKVRMAADIKRQVKGKLAQDATPEALVELLDALEDVIPEAGPDVEFKKLEDVAKPDDEPAEDADDTALREFLKGLGLSDEDIDTACAKANAPAAASEDSAPSDLGSGGGGLASSEGGGSGSGGGSTRTYAPVDTGNYRSTGASDKKAMDAQFKTLQRTVAAMDSKIAQARKDGAADAIKTQREIFAAINFVKPWVGELPAMDAADNAEEVLRTALIAMDEKDVDDLPEKAMRRMIEKMPKPGERRTSDRKDMAHDAAAAKSVSERFGTSRISHGA